MPRLLYFFLFAFVLRISVQAQMIYTPGLVVTEVGDTLRGEVRVSSNTLIWFRASRVAKGQAFTPTMIRTCQSDENVVKSLAWNEGDSTRRTFAREVINGYVSLYELIKTEKQFGYIMLTPAQEVIPLRGSLLIQQLTECSDESVKRLLTTPMLYYSRQYFERIINAYNACMRPQASKQKRKKRVSTETGLLAGGAVNSWYYGAVEEKFKLFWNQNGAYSPTYTAVVGGFLTFFPKKQVSLSVEALYSAYAGNRTVYINNPADPNDKRFRIYSFHEKYIKLPLTARYAFLLKPARCYLKVGPSLGYKLSVGGEYSGADVQNVPVQIRPGFTIGYLAGLGVELPIGKQQHLLVEIRTAPHIVTDNVTRLADSRSYQLTVALPLTKSR